MLALLVYLDSMDGGQFGKSLVIFYILLHDEIIVVIDGAGSHHLALCVFTAVRADPTRL